MVIVNKKDKIKAELFRFLSFNIVAVIATTNKKEPSNSLVYYFVDDDMNFYFETLNNTNKYKNININSSVSLLVVEEKELVVVKAKGEAVELNGEEKKKMRKNLLNKRYDFKVKKWPPHEMHRYRKKEMEIKKVIFKITPYELYFLNFGNKSYPVSYSSVIDPIISDKK